MANLNQKVCGRHIPLRIWGSLKGLEPFLDFVKCPNENQSKELVLAVEETSLHTIARINGTKSIIHNERTLVDYALHQMSPVRSKVYYEVCYDLHAKKIYDYYNQILNDSGA